MIKKWLQGWLEIKKMTHTIEVKEIDRYDSGPLWKEIISLRNLMNTLPFQHPDMETVRELTERFNGLFENLTKRVGDLEGAGAKVAQRIYTHDQSFKLLGVKKE